MAATRTLVKEAAYYSMSSIVWRIFNILMLPIFTYVMSPAGGEYGLMTNLYGWGSLFTVLLSMGLETTFMRIAGEEEQGISPARAYSTAVITLMAAVALFVAIGLWQAPHIAMLLGYPTHRVELRLMLCVIAIDALLVLPYCYLRYTHQAHKYAFFKALYGMLNAVLCFYVLVVCPILQQRWPGGLLWDFYIDNNALGYVLGCNIVAGVLVLYMLIEVWNPFGTFLSSTGRSYTFRYIFDAKLFSRSIRYALPILGASVISIGIQNADRILYPWLVPGPAGMSQLSIYGACFRIAMIMALVTQVLRDLLEPVMFRARSAHDTHYATSQLIMRYFIITALSVFMLVTACSDVIRVYLLRDMFYWEGMSIVPVLMASELMLGLQFYYSFWYKLSDAPGWGTLFSAITFVVIVGIDICLVPRMGYMACAIAILTGNVLLTVLTYCVGRSRSAFCFKIGGLKRHLLAAVVAYGLMLVPYTSHRMGLRLSILALYCIAVIAIERIQRQDNGLSF